jgi:hypothetical protein
VFTEGGKHVALDVYGTGARSGSALAITRDGQTVMGMVHTHEEHKTGNKGEREQGRAGVLRNECADAISFCVLLFLALCAALPVCVSRFAWRRRDGLGHP